ncbi:uncharacterized protein [Venturia canescens]|uniref:uncharacterized protein n=1 Tax=Venturia canescens TaxID=32260 RepID=UPI001C9D60D0|nr:uncharacterized protein LOC122407216 [Venturia canescens]
MCTLFNPFHVCSGVFIWTNEKVLGYHLDMHRLPALDSLMITMIVLVTFLTGSWPNVSALGEDIDRPSTHYDASELAGPRRRNTETFVELVEREGYIAEEHEVTTEDGYILSIHRIPGGPKSPMARGKSPVVLIHGLLAASDIWVLRGPEHDLAYQLVDNGYDVWALNSRGNYYGKRHKYLSVKESHFWRFSWHEIGTFDSAASIDYILSLTGMPRVSLVGHSMGSTVELVLLSKKPEYNDKIHVALTFAPVAIFTHSLPGLVSKLGIRFGKHIEEALKLLDMFELFPRDGMDLTFYVSFCQRPRIRVLCQSLASYLFGLTNCEEFDVSMLPRLLNHYPQGTSIETLLHYRQIVMSGKFKQYDFGPMSNYLRYKSFAPPEYPLENITAPLVLYYAPNDPYTTKKDTEAVLTKIPNAISREIPYSNFGHLDFLFLKDTKRLLYDDVIEVLDGYRTIGFNGLGRDVTLLVRSHCISLEMSTTQRALVNHIFLAILAACTTTEAFNDRNPDIDLKTPELATKYGYPLEAHKVETADGYVLEIHRIPHGRIEESRWQRDAGKVPILLQHGLAGSSADWVISGPGKALAYILADEGYDVWLGNNRGNIYSRQNRFLVPENRTFWNFSFHELGVYDLPATIDHVLKVTRRQRLLYIGHSQGSTQFWVMTSVRPEYNDKVALAIGLAPAAFTGNLRGPITQLARLTYFGVWVGERFGWPELGSRSEWGKFVSSFLCHEGAPTQVLCSNTLFLVAGYSQGELDLANLTVIIGHVPAGASWKQLVHFGQGYMRPGTFRAFDYVDKKKNLRLYDSPIPPDYELDKITAPVALFSSDNDRLATPEDVGLLSLKLRNIVLNEKVPSNNFNHYDFLWGKTAPQMIYEKILRLLEKYRRELIEKYGYRGETHQVTTEDGYGLEVHRITGTNSNPGSKGKQPILLMHGLLTSSVDWIITGPGRALGYILADEGYDVWMGNNRGNTFSREHKKYSVLEEDYWKFSWHEVGCSDLPAMIDYILIKTNKTELIYTGHSQGTTDFWRSFRITLKYDDNPMENEKEIKFKKNSSFFKFLPNFPTIFFQKLMSLIGLYEFEPTSELLKELISFVCENDSPLQRACENIIFLVSGFGSDQLNTTMLTSILAHVPAGASVRQIIHYGQVVKSGKFQQYDHGWVKNWRKYKSLRPPLYDLSRIKVPVSLHYASNDWLSDPRDVDHLYRELGNPIGKFRVPHESFGHIDFLWAKDGKELLYDKIVSLMKKYAN